MKLSKKNLDLLIENYLQEDDEKRKKLGDDIVIKEIRLYDSKVEIYVNKPPEHTGFDVSNLIDTFESTSTTGPDGQTVNVSQDLSEFIEDRYEFTIMGAAQEVRIRNCYSSAERDIDDEPDSQGRIKRGEHESSEREEGLIPLSEIDTIEKTHENGKVLNWQLRGWKSSDTRDKKFQAEIDPGSIDYRGIDKWDYVAIYQNGDTLLSAVKLEEEYDQALFDDKYVSAEEMSTMESDELHALKIKRTSEALGLPEDFVDPKYGNLRAQGQETYQPFYLEVSATVASRPTIDTFSIPSFGRLSDKLNDKRKKTDQELQFRLQSDAKLNFDGSGAAGLVSLMPPSRNWSITIDPPLTSSRVASTMFYIRSAHKLSATRSVKRITMPDGKKHSKITIGIQIAERWKSKNPS